MKPEDVLHNWDIPGLDSDSLNLRPADSGWLNKTFLFRAGESGNELFILQCVHHAVSMDGAMNNYFHVTQFLQDKGLPTQTVVKTKSGDLWIDDVSETAVTDQLWRWRLLRGVEGEVFDQNSQPELIDAELAETGGAMLAQFHTTLSDYPDKLEVGRLSFRYEQEVEKLRQFEKQLMADPDESIREVTQLLLKEMPKLALPSGLPEIIIHADPKVSNFIFNKDKTGVCMIDLDTVQTLSPLYDIGDALRSWSSQKEDDPNNTYDTSISNAFIKGYLDNSKGLLSEQEQSLIPQVTKLITLGLATRFINDYVEDFYFGWHADKYESRKAHNRARAMGQISLYKSLSKD